MVSGNQLDVAMHSNCMHDGVRQADGAAPEHDAGHIDVGLLVLVVPRRHEVLGVDERDDRQAARMPPEQPDVEPAGSGTTLIKRTTASCHTSTSAADESS